MNSRMPKFSHGSLRSRVLLKVAVISLCAGFFACGKKNEKHEGPASRPEGKDTRGLASQGADGSENKLGKRTRSSHRAEPRPGEGDTIARMHRTRLPLVDLPDQNVVERVRSLNGMLGENGIPPEEFGIVVDERVLRIWEEEGNPGGFELGVMELRDVSLVDLMKHVCGRTLLRFRVGRGEAVITLSQFLPARDLEIPEGADPFAEFPQKEAPGETLEDDPFSPQQQQSPPDL